MRSRKRFGPKPVKRIANAGRVCPIGCADLRTHARSASLQIIPATDTERNFDMELTYKTYADIFKALSDETRLRIVDMLSCSELSACDILQSFSLSQSTLSYHMKILVEAGVVKSRREGLWTRYSINEERFDELLRFLPQLFREKDKCICQQIKYCKEDAQVCDFE